MWFAKWFGGRKEVEDKDEPARFAAPQQIRSLTPRPVGGAPAKTPGQAAQKGFDPYNSGAFERRNGWEKVIIRR